MIEVDTIIQLMIAISAVASLAYAIIKDKIPNKYTDLRNIKSILERREEIRGNNKYLQDLELNTVRYLKGFKWLEAEVLLDKNIGLLTLSNLRALSRRKLLVIYDNKIVIPSRSYIVKKYLYSFKSYLSVLNFILSILLILYFISYHSLEGVSYILLLLYMLMSELICLHHFDSLTSFNLIQESGDIAGNDIVISQDFDKELRG